MLAAAKSTEIAHIAQREEDGRWLAEVPEIPGVLAYGDTANEAMAKAEVLALRVLAEHNRAREEFRRQVQIGIDQLERGEYTDFDDESLKEFLLAAHFMPNQAEPHNNIGQVYHVQKRYDEALKSYDKSLSLDPGYDLAYVNRGKTLLVVGRKDQAIADFRRALQINPANGEAAEQLQAATAPR